MIGRYLASLLFAVALAACGRDGLAATLNAPVQLAVGQSAVFKDADLKVQVVDVNDSRCPNDVACFWAGVVDVQLAIRSRGRQSRHAVDDSHKATVDGYTIEILEVLPPRGSSSLQIARADYRITLKVTR